MEKIAFRQDTIGVDAVEHTVVIELEKSDEVISRALDPGDARELARLLIEAAEAAEEYQ